MGAGIKIDNETEYGKGHIYKLTYLMAKNNTVVQQGTEARLYIQREKRILTPASYHTQKSMRVRLYI